MILKNLIYILQSENYSFKRFLKFAYTHLKWWGLENRQKIVWTRKALAIWVISLLIFCFVIVLFFITFNILGLLVIPFLIVLLPIIIGIALYAIMPLDIALKQQRIASATKIVSASSTMVIGVTGSYGKTSTKEILATILEQKFRVIKTPENINTDLGIAEFIINNKDEFRDDGIFIVEMGAHKMGELAKICRMICPSYSILTGINESHLERFGNLENIINGKFELPKNTKDLALLNFDDENINKNYSKFNLKNCAGTSKQEASNVKIKENFKGLEFEWEGRKFETSLLAEHNIALILLCARIAKELAMSLDDIYIGVKKIQPVMHRLQPIYNSNTDIMIIDDSYNGNFNGIKSGIAVINKATGRKVVLTPGLVELGSEMQDVHIKIGELYASSIDLVLLIENKMTHCIIKGLEKNKFVNYKVYKTTQAAHNDLKNVLKRGDAIVFQNDLTDNYF
ncbi:MAG: UDP-N-acetylmuramoyl-tripeptide--D-alanyl-D-alanine ligase [Parcubacteria group bacterium]|jgi:UDP-N-acetylmuramoyl-tripeptide--D-alanyl-D-alanine ligase